MCDYTFNSVWNVMFSVLSVLQGCIFIIIQPWFILLWNIFNAICFMCFILVNSVIVSSIISCNDLYQNFIIMYVWYFISRNSISVRCDMAFIEPMHRNKPNITYLLTCFPAPAIQKKSICYWNGSIWQTYFKSEGHPIKIWHDHHVEGIMLLSPEDAARGNDSRCEGHAFMDLHWLPCLHPGASNL